MSDTPMVETSPTDAIVVRGSFRLQIAEDGKVVGDSGWIKNQITNEGKRNYLARLLGALASSSQVSHMGLGTGTAPAAADTTLAGEVTGTGATVRRAAVTAATSGSTAVQFTATFASSNGYVSATYNIANIGLFAASNGGTVFAGNTYASSSCATNQDVYTTYTITF